MGFSNNGNQRNKETYKNPPTSKKKKRMKKEKLWDGFFISEN